MTEQAAEIDPTADTRETAPDDRHAHALHAPSGNDSLRADGVPNDGGARADSGRDELDDPGDERPRGRRLPRLPGLDARLDTVDTLPQWLAWRFGHHATTGTDWAGLSGGDRDYWAHEAAAVRRAVERDGFKPYPEAAIPPARTEADHG